MHSELVKQFSGSRYVNLESYWSDGTPELTPVQSVEHDGVLYLRTDPRAGKVGRIRGSQVVRVVPCDRKGTPRGTWMDGEAHLIEGAEYERVRTILNSRPGPFGNLIVSLMARLKGQRLTVMISVRLVGPSLRGDASPPENPNDI
jgi:hypothetical protein